MQLGDEFLCLFILECGGDINATNANGEVPLHDAVKRGDIEIIKELLTNGADVNVQPFKGYIYYKYYMNV